MSKHLVNVLIGLGLCVCGCTHQPPKQEMTQVPPMSFMKQDRIDLQLASPIKSLYVGDQYVIVYTQDNQAWGLTRSGLSPVFAAQITSPDHALFAPVMLKDWAVYPTNATLEVLDYKGRLVRSMRLDTSIRSSAVGAMVGDTPTLFVGTDARGGGRLAAFDTSDNVTNKPKWEIMAPGKGISAAPAIFQGFIFAGGGDGKVYAANFMNKGGAIWLSLPQNVYSTQGPIVADLAADKDGVYVASMDSKLYSLSINDGRAQWQFYAQRPLDADTQIVPGENSIYLYIPHTGVAAIDKQAEGVDRQTPRWLVADAVQYLSRDDKFVYLRRTDNAIIAVDKQTGETKFVSKRNDFTAFGTNPKPDGVIYAANAYGQVYTIVPVFRTTLGEIVMDVRPMGPVALANVNH